MIIDTHCHLDFDQFNPDRDAVMERASRRGVTHFINVGSSLEGSRKSVKLATEHENIFATVGIHPHHAHLADENALAEIEKLAGDKNVVAIGEVGLDYFKSPAPRDAQKGLFVKFIALSERRRLPLVVHNRDARGDILDILRDKCRTSVRGVMHCFSGDRKFLEKTLDMGMFVSFTCNLTFKNAGRLREVAKYVPHGRILLETDAPFLAPQARRGERNEPAYITELSGVLSNLLGLPESEIEKITTENAKKLFKLKI